MFTKILIANRGEIACRIAKTARRMGISTVAVYSEADAQALHVAQSDEAHLIGPAPARESYLLGRRILQVAKEVGAEAIHPGYGFLSENAGFARDCKKAGIVFIGPPDSAIEAMGSKSTAKALMTEAGVPLVPVYHGDNQDPDFLKSEAEKTGFPLLIKASAGGGGKGMRVVTHLDEFSEALESAKREANSSFGDEHVLLERYLTKPRHVEFQIFADNLGNAVHLFERDCSIQRRHQKVIEEAPAPNLDPSLRDSMGKAAIKAAKAIGYTGAGTVEFLLDEDGSFYFMEMNTRLQVEHPVTEMITNQDLVEWQLRVAAGEPLPKPQNELGISGHAFEARIYAEDPTNDFLPAIGQLLHLRAPEESTSVRIDTGVTAGDEISMHYDPMIAKLIVWAPDRPAAVQKLKWALKQYQILGLTTNIEFLSRLAANQDFALGQVDTGFIPRHQDSLLNVSASTPEEVLALACLNELLDFETQAICAARDSSDPCSPWGSSDGWRLNEDNHHTFQLIHGDQDWSITAHYRKDHFVMELPSGERKISGEKHTNGEIHAVFSDKKLLGSVISKDQKLFIHWQGRVFKLEVHDPRMLVQDLDSQTGNLTAPMPGSIVELRVKEGDRVNAGDVLMILEAMKMEHSILAPVDGVVSQLTFAKGDQVVEGTQLLILDADEE